MKIYIHSVDGSVSEYVGLADHISVERHLENLGYEVFDDVSTPAWCSNPDALCVRSENQEYEAGEYDVAEEDGVEDEE